MTSTLYSFVLHTHKTSHAHLKSISKFESGESFTFHIVSFYSNFMGSAILILSLDTTHKQISDSVWYHELTTEAHIDSLTVTLVVLLVKHHDAF